MKQNVIVAAVAGVVVGILFGFLLRGQISARGTTQGTGVMQNFNFNQFITTAGSSEWEIVEDKIYDRLPPLSSTARIARRIVAQSTMLDFEQNDFAERFQNAAEQWITSCGGTIKGQQEANRATAEAAAQGAVYNLISAPRRYYSLDDVHGVADFWIIANSGKVTVIISFLEGS
jgi:hypothetical protein